MFRNMQAAIASGVSVGFFSGNAVCGRIVWDEATRSFHRVGVFGPPGGTREFESMQSLEHVRPYANELIGAHSTGPVTGGADWICTLPEHWLYAKTGMQQGDAIPGVIGWEYHGDPADIAGLEIVARGPDTTAPGEFNGGEYTATVYPGPKNNFVFNASTCWWADGLSEPPGYMRPSVYTSPQGPDERLQQITRNVLDRMIASRLVTRAALLRGGVVVNTNRFTRRMALAAIIFRTMCSRAHAVTAHGLLRAYSSAT